jgi:hypothetical protein
MKIRLSELKRIIGSEVRRALREGDAFDDAEFIMSKTSNLRDLLRLVHSAMSRNVVDSSLYEAIDDMGDYEQGVRIASEDPDFTAWLRAEFSKSIGDGSGSFY